MNYLNINLGAFGIIATILAIAATVVAFVMIVPESKREKLGRFGKFLHDAVNFKFLIVEKILQALYIFVTAYLILCGFFMLFMAPETWTGRHWLGGYGILLMVLGPIAVRLCYELLIGGPAAEERHLHQPQAEKPERAQRRRRPVRRAGAAPYPALPAHCSGDTRGSCGSCPAVDSLPAR